MTQDIYNTRINERLQKLKSDIRIGGKLVKNTLFGATHHVATYVIFTDGKIINALNVATGIVDASGVDAAKVIQSTIDALATTGGRILIKNGLYWINSAISISNMSVEIEGESLGYRTRYRVLGHQTDPTYYGTWLFANSPDETPIFKLSGEKFFASLSNLVLEGKSSQRSLIQVDGFNDVTINHCFLYRFKNAIDVIGSSHILRIHDNWIEVGARGLNVAGGEHDLMLVSRNYFLGSKESPLCAGIWIGRDLASLIELVIANNVFRTNYHGIRIEKGRDVTICGNTICDGVYGVRLLDVSNIPIVANTFRSLTNGVSEESGAGRNVLVGNTFSEVTDPIHFRVATSQYTTNVGIDPRDPEAIAVGSSPFAYQNVDGSSEEVIVSGGTVSDLSWSRDGNVYYATGLNAGKFHLESLEYLRVTYSSAPTMTRVPSP